MRQAPDENISGVDIDKFMGKKKEADIKSQMSKAFSSEGLDDGDEHMLEDSMKSSMMHSSQPRLT